MTQFCSSVCLNNISLYTHATGFPGGSLVKNLPANAEDMDSIPGLARSSGEGNGNTLQYSCLEHPMDGGAWWAAVYGGRKRAGCDLVTKTTATYMHQIFLIPSSLMDNQVASVS